MTKRESQTDTLNKKRLFAGWNDYVYTGILLVLFAAFTMLFQRQCVRYNGAYVSDTIVYAHNYGVVEKSRMIALIFSALHKIGKNDYAIAVFMSIVVIATILATYYLIDYILRREGVFAERYKIQIMSLMGIVMSAIYLPGIYEQFYIKTWSRYSWHSPTQQAMMLFSILSLLVFLKMYDNYMEQIRFDRWMLLAVLLFLSAWAKPNFMMVFSPVVLIVFIADLFRKKEYSIGHRIRQIILLGSAFIPAGIFLIILSRLEYSADRPADIGVIIEPGLFLKNIDMPVLMIFLSLALPLVVFAFNIPKLKDVVYQLTGGSCLLGIAQYMILAESGRRESHGNFSWGREAGEYLVFIAAMALAYSNYCDKTFLASKPALRKAYFIIVIVLLIGHVLSGIVYLQFVLRGHLYRI